MTEDKISKTKWAEKEKDDFLSLEDLEQELLRVKSEFEVEKQEYEKDLKELEEIKTQIETLSLEIEEKSSKKSKSKKEKIKSRNLNFPEAEEIAIPEVSSELKEITVENVIKENTTTEERKEFQKEDPEKPVEKIIEKAVVEELNDKTIKPVKERKAFSFLEKAKRRIKKAFLLSLVVSTFEISTSFKSPESADAVTYDNVDVKNLKDWENIKLDQDSINKLDNMSIITEGNENSNETYMIVDKTTGMGHLYCGDSLITSYQMNIGENPGDEQTVLASVFKNSKGKIVSANEATYQEDGRSYIKDGYTSYIDYNAGNKKTGAGIYTISQKGKFHGDLAFYLVNERGESVSTAFHKAPMGYINKKDPTQSNGCFRLGWQDLNKLDKQKGFDVGTKVYVLPTDPHNKYQLVDGEIRFFSKNTEVNKTIRPYDPKEIVLKAEGVNETGKEFLLALQDNKEKLMKLYPTVSNDIYNELTKIAYGIFGQESSFGTYGGPTGWTGQTGKIADYIGAELGQNVSAGVTQIRITSVNKKTQETFNIKTTKDLFKTENAAIATMSALLDIYVNSIPNNKKADYEKLVPLFYNNPDECREVIKTEKEVKNAYVKNVLNYSQNVKIYLAN